MEVIDGLFSNTGDIALFQKLAIFLKCCILAPRKDYSELLALEKAFSRRKRSVFCLFSPFSSFSDMLEHSSVSSLQNKGSPSQLRCK